MSMTVSTGDDSDELDDDLERDVDDDRDDEDDDRPQRRSKAKPDEDDEPDDDEDDDRSPDDLRAEIKRLRTSLNKANSSGNRRRQQLKELREANKALSSKDDGTDEEADDDGEKPKEKSTVGLDAKQAQRLVTKAVQRRERELQEAHNRDLIDTRAESALVRAGVSEKNIRLLKRELDYDELDLDPKTRRVEGIDEEIDRLRTEFPDLFKSAKAARRRINGGDDRDAPASKRKALSATEKQVLALTGRAR